MRAIVQKSPVDVIKFQCVARDELSKIAIIDGKVFSGDFLEVQTGNTNHSLTTTTDELAVKKDKLQHSIGIPAQQFRSMVESVAFAAYSKKTGSSRDLALKNCVFTINQDKLEMTASDKHRIARKSIVLNDDAGLQKVMLINAVPLIDFIKTFAKKCDNSEVVMRFNDDAVSFEYDHDSLTKTLTLRINHDAMEYYPLDHLCKFFDGKTFTAFTMRKNYLLNSLQRLESLTKLDRKLRNSKNAEIDLVLVTFTAEPREVNIHFHDSDGEASSTEQIPSKVTFADSGSESVSFDVEAVKLSTILNHINADFVSLQIRENSTILIESMADPASQADPSLQYVIQVVNVESEGFTTIQRNEEFETAMLESMINPAAIDAFVDAITFCTIDPSLIGTPSNVSKADSLCNYEVNLTENKSDGHQFIGDNTTFEIKIKTVKPRLESVETLPAISNVSEIPIKQVKIRRCLKVGSSDVLPWIGDIAKAYPQQKDLLISFTDSGKLMKTSFSNGEFEIYDLAGLDFEHYRDTFSNYDELRRDDTPKTNGHRIYEQLSFLDRVSIVVNASAFVTICKEFKSYLLQLTIDFEKMTIDFECIDTYMKNTKTAKRGQLKTDKRFSLPFKFSQGYAVFSDDEFSGVWFNEEKPDLRQYIGRSEVENQIESNWQNFSITDGKNKTAFDLPQCLKYAIKKRCKNAWQIEFHQYGRNIEILQLFDWLAFRLKNAVKSTSIEIVEIDENDDTRQTVDFIHQYNAANREKIEKASDGVAYREMILAMIPDVESGKMTLAALKSEFKDFRKYIDEYTDAA